jgi:transcriptional regulator with GAF, ATPase, and Fis domain
MCAVFLPGESGMLKIAAKYGYSASFTKSLKIKKGNPVADAYISAKNTVVRSISALEGENYSYFFREGAVSQTNVPLTDEHGAAVGVLNVSSKEGGVVFYRDIVDIILMAQRYLSAALRSYRTYGKYVEENSRIKSEMSAISGELVRINSKFVRKVKDIKSLLAILRLANSSRDITQIGDFIIKKIKDISGFETSAILVERGDCGGFYLASPSFGYDKERLSGIVFDSQSSTSKAVTEISGNGSPVFFNDAEEIKNAMPEFYPVYNMNSAVFVPVKRANGLKAALVCVNKQGAKINVEDLSTLEHIAAIIDGAFDKFDICREYNVK